MNNDQALSLQQSVRVTIMGRLSDFECRVDMCLKLHDADAANVQQAEIQVQQQLLQALLGMSVTPVQAVAPATNVIDCLMSSNEKRTGMHAQQGCNECTREAQQLRKLLLMHQLSTSKEGGMCQYMQCQQAA